TLDQLRRRTGQGLDRVRRSQARAGDDNSEAVAAAATRFRYDRGLLSAEELDEWLERWELTIGEWGDYLERSLLLEQDESDAPAERMEDASAAAATYVDAVCSGFLEREALEFAADAALAGVVD